MAATQCTKQLFRYRWMFTLNIRIKKSVTFVSLIMAWMFGSFKTFRNCWYQGFLHTMISGVSNVADCARIKLVKQMLMQNKWWAIVSNLSPFALAKKHFQDTGTKLPMHHARAITGCWWVLDMEYCNWNMEICYKYKINILQITDWFIILIILKKASNLLKFRTWVKA